LSTRLMREQLLLEGRDSEDAILCLHYHQTI
jgi:hypothetical protein